MFGEATQAADPAPAVTPKGRLDHGSAPLVWPEDG
jgi:hypothetical protein